MDEEQGLSRNRPVEDLRDDRRRREFLKIRALATGLLVAMAGIFAAARWGQPEWPWLSYVEAFAEAAMVGALADWFAVVALFRRPFGLPIPHTAIVSRNKERIGASLGHFIATNFLGPDVLARRIGSAGIAAKAAQWLAEPRNALFLSRRLAAAVPGTLEALSEEHVKAFVRDSLLRAARDVDAAPVAGRVLSVLIAGGHHQMVFDKLLDVAHAFLVTHRDDLRTAMVARSSWWVPDWVDERLFRKVMTGLAGLMVEMRDPAHPWRVHFDRAARDLAVNLVSSPEHRQTGEAIKQEVLSNALVRSYLESVWSELRARISADARDEQGLIRDAFARGLIALGQRTVQDDRMRATVDGWIERAVMHLVVPHREELGGFVAGVVARWDSRTFVSKLELQVGKDLQYIRINGTLVGGLAGLLIHVLTGLVG
jgi:uncharacterized membrane-anchored protein YjiN (DUF445 family)